MYALDDTVALQEAVIEDFSIVGCYGISELCRVIVHLSVGSSSHTYISSWTAWPDRWRHCGPSKLQEPEPQILQVFFFLNLLWYFVFMMVCTEITLLLCVMLYSLGVGSFFSAILNCITVSLAFLTLVLCDRHWNTEYVKARYISW